MSDFDLFDQYENLNNETEKEHTNVNCLKNCKHAQIIEDNGIKLCLDCGEEINREIGFEKEWRYYGSSDTRHNSDPSRCHIRKTDEKNIFKDVENMKFNDKIIGMANSLYEKVTNGKIFRGNSRKAIVFACVFHAYKMAGTPQSCDTLVKIFNLEKKVGLRGLKHVNLNAPKELDLKTSYIKPEDIIKEIMEKFDAGEEQCKEVIEIYKQVKNKSSIINRSRPQSIASGTVRYYILKNKKDISMSDFRSKTGLSELTINRIVKEISTLLKTPEITP